jgi:membrane-associated phospholipid phosphatase
MGTHYYDACLRAMPWFLYFAGVMYTVVSGNPIGILFTVGLVVFGNLFNQVLKYATEHVCGQHPLCVRPNPPADGCGSFARAPGTSKVTYGMPSGHAQQLAFTMGFWVCHFLQSNAMRSTWQRALGIGFFVVLWALVAYHRVQLGCHNTAQVVVGSLVGVVCGVLFYQLASHLLRECCNGMSNVVL